MLGLPLTFTVPLVLTALAALPAIWLLLRITPPQPLRVDFPPLKIMTDMRPERETPARTPWWLLLLRLLLAAFLILAASGPIWNPLAESGSRAPLVLLVDNGFTSAHDWRERSCGCGDGWRTGRNNGGKPGSRVGALAFLRAATCSAEQTGPLGLRPAVPAG
ncbi:MAG: hypothetical protein K0S56_3239 [Microvirga sp.]|nr:hypothetical protein [Microvirga sp.]